MAGVNRYFRFSKISEAKFRALLRCFALDLTATQTAQITGISLRSVNQIYLRLRGKLAHECERKSPFACDLEADESYFGPRWVRGRRGRGAGGKTIVFELLKRDDQVYAEIVPNASKATLQAIIRGKASLESVLHTNRWRGYDGLVDLGFDGHLRVNHGDNEFVLGPNHINGIGASGATQNTAWPSSTDGMKKSTFHLHLKETEFRFSQRKNNLYKVLLSILRKDPL